MSKEGLFEKAASDLAIELATMHGTLFNLIVELRNTELSRGQPTIINAAEAELIRSQKAFFANYADMVGGATPECN
jgi:hypothetical protein